MNYRNLLLAAFCFLTAMQAKSQRSVQISYAVTDIAEYSEDFKAKYPEAYEDRQHQKEMAHELLFFLDIQGSRALFYHPQLSTNDEQLSIMFTRAGGRHVFYSDTKENLNIEGFEYWRKHVIIETEMETNPWTLTGEKRQIANYTCYKATRPILNDLATDGKARQVEAWYTEEIPVRFGPKNYHGLPGLILELREDEMSYHVKNINFNSGVTVSKPKLKGEKMTPEQFRKEAPAIRQKAKELIRNSRG